MVERVLVHGPSRSGAKTSVCWTKGEAGVPWSSDWLGRQLWGGGGGGRGEGKCGRPGTKSDLRTHCAAIRPFCLGGPKIGVQYTEAPLIRAMQA